MKFFFFSLMFTVVLSQCSAMFTTPSSWPYSRCGSYGGGNQPPTITKEQNSLFFQHTITKEILTNGEEYGGFSFPNQVNFFFK